MASMNCKRMVAVATLATSVGHTTGLAPDPVGVAVETGRNTAADGLNQIKRALQSLGDNH